MSIEEFISKFEECFEGIEPSTLKTDTEFRNLESWDSLTALTLLAMIDAEFEVAISAGELRSCNKVQEIFDLIKTKIQ